LNKFLISFALTFISTIGASQSIPVAIVGAKFYPSPTSQPLINSVILVKEGKIEFAGRKEGVAIPSSYQIINANGKVITAGFWNCHVHLIEPKWNNAATQPADSLATHLQQMLSSWGVTYAFDLAQLEFANLNAIRSRISTGEMKGPTIYSVGVPFTSRSPVYIRPVVLPELRMASEVKAHISRQLAEGSNGIKLWSVSPTGSGLDFMPDSLIQLAASMMRAEGKPLFAHPTNNAGMLKAVRNGVTVLSHTSPDDRAVWDPPMVDEMLKADISVIPTLKLCAWELQRFGNQDANDPLITTAIQQLSVFHQAGGSVLFGTDVGYMSDYDPSAEYKMMQRAGLSFAHILASLTVNPAKKFGFENSRGKVEKGFDADLVILDADPSTDIRNLSKVNMVMHRGQVIYKNGK
jgi:dihydroorotase-like cyclic amidohydrolase